MYIGEPHYHLSEQKEPATSPSASVTPPGAGTLPYREALEETEKRQREEYLRDCANVTVLQMTPANAAQMSITLALRRWMTVMLLASCFISLTVPVQAIPPPLWLKPSHTDDRNKVPVTDGRLTFDTHTIEYAQGRKWALNNWQGDGQLDGEMYLQIQSKDSPLQARCLFIGVKIPRKVNPSSTYDDGTLTFYIDTDRIPQGGAPTAADRQIVISFYQPNAISEPFGPINIRGKLEYAGNGTGTPTLVSSGSGYLQDNEVYVTAYDDRFLYAELRLILPPTVGGVFDDERLGFSFIYRDEGYTNQYPVFTIPNQYDKVETMPFIDKTTWGTIDLKLPGMSKLSTSIYNVGLLTGDWRVPAVELLNVHIKIPMGGVGWPADFGNRLFQRDLVCITEAMDSSHRDSIFDAANRNRKANGMSEYRGKVTGEEDKPPNNMIMTSWFVVGSGSIRYSTLGVSGAPDDNVYGSARGSKGVVWARIAAPMCAFTGGPPDVNGKCPEDRVFASPDEWFDVFCTHTQADANAENENASHRRRQFQKLREYIDARRATVRNGTNGFDRPALLLGDLNQVGPRSIPNNASKYAEMTTWLNTVEDTYPPVQNNDIVSLKAEYKFMRETLGNWDENLFDGLNDDAIESYDITANTRGEGTWLGEENKASVSRAQTKGVGPGYPRLNMVPRLDYIMLIPASSESFPSWGFRFDPTLEARAFVNVHHIDEGNYEIYAAPPASPPPDSALPAVDVGMPPRGIPEPELPQDVEWVETGKLGYLSDHTEVMAQFQLMRMGTAPTYNPTKTHRVKHRIAWLSDTNSSDGKWTDWYTPFLRFTGSYADSWNKTASYSDDDTPDCKRCDPGWFNVSNPYGGTGYVLSELSVNDWDWPSSDDHYDGDPTVGCWNSKIVIKHQWPGEVALTNCHNGAWGAPVNNFAATGGNTITLQTRGNGDDGDNDVEVTHELWVCTIDEPC